jgi:arabinan endo-1,5-alpha-L-arabinosidase
MWLLTGTCAVPLMAFCLAATPVPAQAFPNPRHLTGATTIHDPSTVVGTTRHRFEVYGTDNQALIATSPTSFRAGGPAFRVRPRWWFAFSPIGNLWGPDVSFHARRYWLYYAVSSVGSNNSAIGLATSSTGEPGSWRDRGIVLRSGPPNGFNAIGPNLLVDRGGRWWLTFGSYWGGIFVTRLNPRTGKPFTPAPGLTQVATRNLPSNAIEGPFLIQRGAYFYLFASFDYCCRGTRSTYNIRVGRSRSPTGPFVDRPGTRLLNGGGSIVLASHSFVHGPGGESIGYDPRARRYTLVYHYYDARRGGIPTLGINNLSWTRDGWPYAS